MTIVLKLNKSDFSGSGLPNVQPFVEVDSLNFGYDFSPRTGFLGDLSGNLADPSVYVNDYTAKTTAASMDAIVQIPDGIRLEGYMTIPKVPPVIPFDGSLQFTIMVLAARSGVGGVSNTSNGNNGLYNIIDLGTYVNGSSGLAMEFDSTGAMTVRIESPAPVLRSTINTEDKTIPQLCFLTFDGTNFTLVNKTSNEVITGTKEELGIDSEQLSPYSGFTTMKVGSYRNDTLTNGGFPNLYQIAYWDKVLTNDQIEDQYLRSAAAHLSLEI